MKLLIVLVFALLFPTLLTAQEPASGPPANYQEPLTGIEMIFIKGGSFAMGDTQGTGRTHDLPVHSVTVTDFYIGKHEITFEQFEHFSKATEKNLPDDNGWGSGSHPIINVSWIDAVQFAEWLSNQTGRTFRLPTEAEWEYAARGGTTSNYWWGETFKEDMANCRDCGSQWDGKETSPVGSFAANPYGLHDMTGNVYEWCLDTKHKDYTDAPSDGSAWLGGDQNQRITRGGSWMRPRKEMQSSVRCWDQSSKRLKEVGFRLVMEKE